MLKKVHRQEQHLITFISGIDEAELAVSDEEDDQEGDSSSDDGMDLTPKTRREVDEIIERQDKRSRGLQPDDKECRTPRSLSSGFKARKSLG